MRTVLLILLVPAAFCWGLAAGVYKIFPFEQARALQDGIANALPQSDAPPAYRSSDLATARGLEMADWDTQAQIVMVGDSITEMAPWKDMFPDADILNRGASGDTISGVEERLPAILRANPQSAFVLAGVNDLNLSNDVDAILSIYRRTVDQLTEAGVTPHIQSLPPCGEQLELCTPERRSAEKALNTGLRNLAKDSGAIFIDLERDFPRGKAYRDDGVHMTQAGFKAWRDILAPYIAKAGAPADEGAAQ